MKKTLFEGKYLKLFTHQDWEFVQRKNCTGIAIVVALTDENKVIFIEQYRVPIGKKVIELPGGLVNDDNPNCDESTETAARRELLEETGYEAAEITPLVKGPVNTGLSSDDVTFFRAKGLVKKGDGGGVDDYEDITVHEVPLKDARAWLMQMNEKGVAVDPKVYVGLYFLHGDPVQ